MSLSFVGRGSDMGTSAPCFIETWSKPFAITVHTHTLAPKWGKPQRTYYCLANLKISWWELYCQRNDVQNMVATITWDKPGKSCTLSLMQQQNIKIGGHCEPIDAPRCWRKTGVPTWKNEFWSKNFYQIPNMRQFEFSKLLALRSPVTPKNM